MKIAKKGVQERASLYGSSTESDALSGDPISSDDGSGGIVQCFNPANEWLTKTKFMEGGNYKNLFTLSKYLFGIKIYNHVFFV